MMFLEVNLTSWADRWYLAGISVVTVFVILIVLVFILQIFNYVALKGKTTKAAALKAPVPVANASEEEKAAVATALYLYLNDSHDTESGVLTIKPHHSAWHGVLNTRL